MYFIKSHIETLQVHDFQIISVFRHIVIKLYSYTCIVVASRYLSIYIKLNEGCTSDTVTNKFRFSDTLDDFCV